MPAIDRIVDQFVDRLRSAQALAIQRIDAAPWFGALEQKLPKRLPASAQSLYRRYSFPAFDLRGISFFGNTGEQKDDDLDVAIFVDKTMSEMLLRSALIQIGRPEPGDYDAICFDGRVGRQNREYPLVRIDHEQILCNNRIVLKNKIAPSFIDFMQTKLNESIPQD